MVSSELISVFHPLALFFKQNGRAILLWGWFSVLDECVIRKGLLFCIGPWRDYDVRLCDRQVFGVGSVLRSFAALYPMATHRTDNR